MAGKAFDFAGLTAQGKGCSCQIWILSLFLLKIPKDRLEHVCI